MDHGADEQVVQPLVVGERRRSRAARRPSSRRPGGAGRRPGRSAPRARRPTRRAPVSSSRSTTRASTRSSRGRARRRAPSRRSWSTSVSARRRAGVGEAPGDDRAEAAGGTGDRDHASVERLIARQRYPRAACAVPAAPRSVPGRAPPRVPKTMSTAESRLLRDQRRCRATRSPSVLAELPEDRQPEDRRDRADRPERPGDAAAQVLATAPSRRRTPPTPWASALVWCELSGGGSIQTIHRITTRPTRDRDQGAVGEAGEAGGEQPGEAEPAHDHARRRCARRRSRSVSSASAPSANAKRSMRRRVDLPSRTGLGAAVKRPKPCARGPSAGSSFGAAGCRRG